MGWYGPNNCGCCTPECTCEDNFPDSVGLGGIDASVSGTHINLACTASTPGACGWNCDDQECQSSGSALIRLFGPSTCPGPDDPMDYGLFYGPTRFVSGGATNCGSGNDDWAEMQLVLGVNCIDGSPLWTASYSWGYAVFIRNGIFAPPFNCYDYDITLDLIGNGYSGSGSSYSYYSGDPFSGDYLAHTAIKLGSGSTERWILTCLMSRSSADPADLIGYNASGFAPLFNPAGSSLTGSVL